MGKIFKVDSSFVSHILYTLERSKDSLSLDTQNKINTLCPSLLQKVGREQSLFNIGKHGSLVLALLASYGLASCNDSETVDPKAFSSKKIVTAICTTTICILAPATAIFHHKHRSRQILHDFLQALHTLVRSNPTPTAIETFVEEWKVVYESRQSEEWSQEFPTISSDKTEEGTNSLWTHLPFEDNDTDSNNSQRKDQEDQSIKSSDLSIGLSSEGSDDVKKPTNSLEGLHIPPESLSHHTDGLDDITQQRDTPDLHNLLATLSIALPPSTNPSHQGNLEPCPSLASTTGSTSPLPFTAAFTNEVFTPRHTPSGSSLNTDSIDLAPPGSNTTIQKKNRPKAVHTRQHAHRSHAKEYKQMHSTGSLKK